VKQKQKTMNTSTISLSLLLVVSSLCLPSSAFLPQSLVIGAPFVKQYEIAGLTATKGLVPVLFGRKNLWF
jgi:hypothetical protein